MSNFTEYFPHVISGLIAMTVFILFIAIQWMKIAKTNAKQVKELEVKLFNTEKNLDSTLASTRDMVIRHEEDRVIYEQHVKNLDADIQQHKEWLDSYSDKLAIANSKVESLSDDVLKTDKKIEILQMELDYNGKTIDSLTDENSVLKERIELLSKENFDYSDRNATLANLVEMGNAERKELSDKIAVLSAPISVLRVRTSIKRVCSFMYLPTYKLLLTERELKQASKRFNSSHIIVD